MLLLKRTLIALILILVLSPLASAAPLGRSFTYQGELSQSGTPVEGVVNLRFSLWDAVSGGTQIGASQIASGITATHGLFTAEVDAGGEFGALAFNGQARWLQVEVCSDPGCSSTTVLGPRQALTGAPYALGPWQTSGSDLDYVGGNVGIGTATPQHSLHVKMPTPAMILEDSATPATNQTGYLAFWNSNPSETGWVGYGTIGSPLFSVVNVRPAGDIQLYTAVGPSLVVKSAGSVGIGTSTPASKLEVRGDVRLGASGEYFAAGGQENLKIVRGEVLAAGSVNSGSGFTVSKTGTGTYTISFSPAFTGTNHPAITLTPVATSGTLILMLGGLPGPSSALVRVVNGSGTATDGAFSFIAVGAK